MTQHLPGSLYAPLNKSFNTSVGSTADPEADLLLVIDDDRIEEAVRDLVRVGYDNARYYITPADLKTYFADGGKASSIARTDFNGLQASRLAGQARVLDVRFASEFDAAHIPGATNISYTRLADRLAEIHKEGQMFVHCAGGGRAAVASALLTRAGHDVAFVDGSFDEWAAHNLTPAEKEDHAEVTA